MKYLKKLPSRGENEMGQLTFTCNSQAKLADKAEKKLHKFKKSNRSMKTEYDMLKREEHRTKKKIEKLGYPTAERCYVAQNDGARMVQLSKKETVVVDGEKRRVKEVEIPDDDFNRLNQLLDDKQKIEKQMDRLEGDLKKSDKKLKKHKKAKSYYEKQLEQTQDMMDAVEHFNRYVRPASVVDDPDWWLEEVPSAIDKLASITKDRGKESARLFKQAVVLLSEVDTRDMDDASRASFENMCQALYSYLTNGTVKIRYLTIHVANIFNIVCSENKITFAEDILGVYTRARYKGLFKGSRQKHALNRIAKINRTRADRASYNWKYFEKQNENNVSGKDLDSYTKMKDHCLETSKKSWWEKVKQWCYEMKDAIFTTAVAVGSMLFALFVPMPRVKAA